MAELTDASIPKFAAGCRWGGTTEAPVVLFPEGAIKSKEPGRVILELCDGQFYAGGNCARSWKKQFFWRRRTRSAPKPSAFLEQLHDKRIIDY